MTGFVDKPVVRGDRVVLRPIVAGDAASMWADLDDEEANRLTATREQFTREQIERWCATRGDQDDRLDMAVTDAATAEWLGEVVVLEWDPVNRSCGFRIALSAGARDRGVGTEATRLLVDHVFGSLDDPAVNRIDLEVYSFNPRAAAVYEKVGFVREGRRRETLLWDGEWVDTIHMGMLRSDWEATRATARQDACGQRASRSPMRAMPSARSSSPSA